MNCVTHCVIYNEMCLRHKWNPFSSPAMIVSSLLLRWWFFHRLDTVQFLLQTVRLAALHAKWIPYCLDKLNSIILNYRCQMAKQNNSFKVWEENLYFSIAKSAVTLLPVLEWDNVKLRLLSFLGYYVLVTLSGVDLWFHDFSQTKKITQCNNCTLFCSWCTNMNINLLLVNLFKLLRWSTASCPHSRP